MTSDGLDEEGKYRVRFEDELYKFEKNDTKVSFDQFIRVLENYFETDDSLIALDANHELEEYFKTQNE